jgi:acyl-homoserine-lactone acylase
MRALRVCAASLLMTTAMVAAAPALARTAPAGTARGPATVAGPAARLSAVIRRTTGGVPHILAHDWASLGFGYGFAFAQDNLCTMANDYVTVEAQRSRYFGPDATYVQRGNGVTVTNLDSDFFFQQIIGSHIVQRLARGVPPQLVDLENGYVKGYNHYLAQVGGAKGVPDPACRGKPWVKPITLADSYLRFYQLMLLAGEDNVIGGIAAAAPPHAGPAAARPAPGALRATAAALAARLRQHVVGGIGSNAVAIGSQGTRSHHGLLLGNPHFPWLGPERFYQAQLTIPGQINVSGASLYGVPLILIGHNANLAWSHTVSTDFRFTPYQLTLVPGHPTEYLFDGKPAAVQPRKVTVMVRQPGGTVVPRTHTLWWTRYGPVFTSLLGVPLPWTTTSAFAFRDANATNLARAVSTWFGLDRAASARGALAVLKKYQGVPWVNTVVADRAGHALYADIGTVPNVPNDLAHKCDTPLGQFTFAALGLPILDGSRSACDWRNDPGAAVPGIFGPSHEPFLLRRDYVTNSNDSYWLSNPHHPLAGFARIIGTEKTARTLRTRIGLIEVQARIDGTDGLGRPGFTVGALRRLDLSGIVYAAQLTRGGLLAMCRRFAASGGAPTSGGGKVPLRGACKILANWNGKASTGQRGAVLFERFWQFASAASPSPFSHPFDLSHPVTTPSGLNTANPAVRTALGDAIKQLDSAHVPLTATVGSVQFVSDHGRHIPVPGGPGDPDGIFNAIYTGEFPGAPATEPDSGSSYIQVISWNSGSCPVGRTILTYSESASSASPHHFDQTLLFSHKQWLPVEFCESQIASDPHLRVTKVTG